MLRTNSPGNVMPPAARSLGRTSAVAGASKRFKFSLCNRKKIWWFSDVSLSGQLDLEDHTTDTVKGAGNVTDKRAIQCSLLMTILFSVIFYIFSISFFFLYFSFKFFKFLTIRQRSFVFRNLWPKLILIC